MIIFSGRWAVCLRDWGRLLFARVFFGFVIFESAQFHTSMPLVGIKRIVHAAVLLNSMRFGFVETDVVQIAAINSGRK